MVGSRCLSCFHALQIDTNSSCKAISTMTLAEVGTFSSLSTPWQMEMLRPSRSRLARRLRRQVKRRRRCRHSRGLVLLLVALSIRVHPVLLHRPGVLLLVHHLRAPPVRLRSTRLRLNTQVARRLGPVCMRRCWQLLLSQLLWLRSSCY